MSDDDLAAIKARANWVINHGTDDSGWVTRARRSVYEVPALVAEVEALTIQRDTARQQSIEWESWGAEKEAAASRLVTLVEPIIERGKGQIGTHSDRCFEYHHGCLAVMVRNLLTAGGSSSDLPAAGSEL